MEKASICPICGDSAYIVLTTKDYHYGNSNQFSLFCCNGCGHCFQYPIPSNAELASFYPKEYYAYKAPNIDLRPRGVRRRRLWLISYYLNYFRGYKHLNLFPNPLFVFLGWLFSYKYRRLVWFHYVTHGKICDFGCGSGQFVALLRYLGWDAEGVEFLADATAAGRSVGLMITHGSSEVLESRPEAFDLITCYHCAEHVPDFRQLFRAFFHAMKPGGTLVVEVPNADAKALQIYGECYYYLTLPVHVHLFSNTSIRQIAKDSGFVDIATKTVSYWDSHAKSWLLQRDIRKGVLNPRFGAHGKWSNLLAKLRSLPRFIRSISPKAGDCLILTCKRPKE